MSRRRSSVSGASQRIRSDIESLNYDIDASSLFEAELQRQPEHVRRAAMAQRWLVTSAVGCVTGCFAYGIDIGAKQLVKLKWWVVFLSRGSDDEPSFWPMFAVYCLYTSALASVAAALVVLVAPIAGGSGIPEVKSYLQGCRVPGLLRTRTLLAKTVGVLCSVASGLVLGKEGPMIHTGAIVAAGLSQGSSKTCRLRTMWLKRFRNDHDKRDFVSAGAAAGVAAAFGAPIGGVLFALEEAATYWSQPLTWRTFFCALCSTLMLNVLLSTEPGNQFGQISSDGLIAFGSFLNQTSAERLHNTPQLVHFPVFVLLGAGGGLLGAAFINLNERLSRWRATSRRARRRRSCSSARCSRSTRCSPRSPSTRRSSAFRSAPRKLRWCWSSRPRRCASSSWRSCSNATMRSPTRSRARRVAAAP